MTIGQDERRALRHRAFALYLLGEAVSFLGTGVFIVALPLEVLHLTSNSLELALTVGADTVISVVFMLIGGAFVDRLSRRAVMITADVVSGLAIGVVAVMTATGHAHVWALVLLAFTFGLADAFFMPASTAIMRDLLPEDLMVAGNSLATLARTAAMFVAGPVLGGVIVVAIGTSWAFGLDGISFAVGAASLVAMRLTARAPGDGAHSGADVDAGTGERAHEEPAATSVREEIRAGLAYSRARPWLWWNMLAMGLANFVGFVPLALLAPLLIRDVLHASPVVYGVNMAVSGIGGVVAALLRKSRDPRLRVPAVWFGYGAAGLAILALGLAPNVAVATVAGVCFLFGTSYGNINWFALMQEQVPPQLQGRVSSLDWMISLLPGPLGLAAAGVAVETVGVRPTLAASGILTLLAGAVALDHRVRDYTYVSGAPAAADPATVPVPGGGAEREIRQGEPDRV